MRYAINFLVVNTRWCYEGVVNRIAVHEKGAIFLDLPRSFTPYISEGGYRYLLDSANIYHSQSLRAVQPIVQLAEKGDFKVYCYKEDKRSAIDENTSFQLLILVLKAKLGRVNLDEWIETIAEALNSERDFGEYEANYISERAEKFNFCMNLSNTAVEHLEELGLEVKYEQLYVFKRPIDLLYEMVNELLSGRVERDRKFETKMFRLIEEHMRFTDLVADIGYETACRFFSQESDS